MDFDYKKYSLENLENWVHDAMSSAEATPQEIYDVIKGVVEDNYYTYKKQTTDAYELLALLNGNGKGHIKAYDEYLEKKKILSAIKKILRQNVKNLGMTSGKNIIIQKSTLNIIMITLGMTLIEKILLMK